MFYTFLVMSVLNFDEVKLLHSIPGVHVRSTGAYADPRHGPTLRPLLPQLEVNDDHVRESFEFNTKKYTRENGEEYDHVLTDYLLDWADVVVYMHGPPEFIHNSIDPLDRHDDVRIIYRSIGQSSPSVESMLRNYHSHFGDRFTIVRYSPNERYIANYQKSSHQIRFYKDPKEFSGWELPTKQSRQIIMSTQAAPERGNFVHAAEALAMSEGLPRLFLGPRNESLEPQCPTCQPSYEELKSLYRGAGLLLYTGTVPASYTMTPIEAMMTGTPIISISGDMWAAEHLGWMSPEVFEVPDLVGALATVTSVEEGKELLQEALYDDDLLVYLSEKNRETALRLFNSEPYEDVEGIKAQWKKILLG